MNGNFTQQLETARRYGVYWDVKRNRVVIPSGSVDRIPMDDRNLMKPYSIIDAKYFPDAMASGAITPVTASLMRSLLPVGTGAAAVLGEKIEPIVGEVAPEQVGTAVMAPAFMGGAVGIGYKAFSLIPKAGAVGKVLQWGKKYGISLLGAGLLADYLLGGQKGTVSGDSVGIPGIDIDLDEVSRELGVGPDWALFGSPEIPGEEVIHTWFTGTTYFCYTRLGNYYVLTKKKGWKRYTPRAPIVLGTRNLTPRKLVAANKRYKKMYTDLSKIYPKPRRRRTPSIPVKPGIVQIQQE